jgi:hypothetical protein
MVLSVTGKILQVEALLLLLPAVGALCYSEFKSVFSFVVSSLAAFAVGIILCLLFKPRNNVIYAREGLIIVALGWIAMSLFGCLPFVIGENIAFVDAFFETVSGFTTTGSSVLRNVEALSHGALLWRSFTHWIGGMGVLVFITAIIPNMSDRSMMTFGFSRDDAGKFLTAYYDSKIYENDPFAKLDQNGVGKLMDMAVTMGKKARPSIHCGICGEHGGDPVSVEFCHKIGLDYVSCSPFRVPIARLAAAQAAIKSSK